ncbi:MAG: alcohol dehydrogenase catalytic domain-containing protein [Rhizobacter sp.]|nr:alcohol dehydrogenase catalytic domain-containing protein [Burkholderiales bacterium]
MKYQSVNRWAFNLWGGALDVREDALAPVTGHEVTVRVSHCGMCHSDLHIRAGGFDMGGGKLSSLERSGVKLPVTMGHEIVGEVVDVGPDVTGIVLGARVVVYPWLGCGECAVCVTGNEHLCMKAARNLGIQLPGGYADAVRVPHERYLVPIGTLQAARAATFACAGITALSAIRKLPETTADDWVAVVGCGGVGMTGVALLSAMTQAKIVAIDPDAAKRDAALANGATLAFDPGVPDALKTISKACNGNIAAAIDFVGSETSSSLAVNLVRRTGHVVIVGLFGGEFKMPLPMFALKSITITGSYVGGLNDLRELVALAQRETLPEIPLDVRPLSTVNQALDDLTHGRVVGRVVLQP